MEVWCQVVQKSYSFNTPNACSTQYTFLKYINCTQKAFQSSQWHRKYIFNPDPVCDEKWNYLDPCPWLVPFLSMFAL